MTVFWVWQVQVGTTKNAGLLIVIFFLLVFRVQSKVVIGKMLLQKLGKLTIFL